MARLPDKPSTGQLTPMGDEERGTSIRSVSAPFAPRFVSGPEIVVEDGEGPVSGRRTAYAPGLLVADKYELLRPLGAGGMGEVWVAHH